MLVPGIFEIPWYFSITCRLLILIYGLKSVAVKAATATTVPTPLKNDLCSLKCKYRAGLEVLKHTLYSLNITPLFLPIRVSYKYGGGGYN